MAAKQYSGDGLAVQATAEGARLSSSFQRLEARVSADGLALASTDRDGGQLRLSADAMRRDDTVTTLPRAGTVTVGKSVVTFARPGLVEEFSTGVDGVRQDFVLSERPAGDGELRVELALEGAHAEVSAAGAALTFSDVSEAGRTLTYGRLRVTDAAGKALTAALEVLADDRLAVRVDDAGAAYPVRIDPTFSDADWVSLNPGMPGAAGRVHDVAADASGNVYIAGEFTFVGSVAATRIAKWDGTTWTALGTGLNGSVYALAVSGADVYAGGAFTTAGGVPATRIARWNGSTWAALGTGMDDGVMTLAVSGTDVYAGGFFTTAGGAPANRIAKWNGSTWTALGSGMNGRVQTLVVSGTDVYAGGAFTTAGGAAANRIARWNGSTWAPFGSGMNATVQALAVSGTDLYAGGDFTTAGGGAANHVAKWNGTTWTALGSGINGSLNALAVTGTDVYAGGAFTTAGGVAAKNMAQWNGSTWAPLGSGTSGDVSALAVSGTDVYAGGLFITAGGVVANGIAQWNGGTWAPLGSGMNGSVQAVAVSGTDVYVGGAFTMAGSVGANYVAKWNGSDWTALGAGMNSVVYALSVSGTDVYAGGAFTTAGGASANYVARWNGASWANLGTGLNGPVYALAVSGTDLYVGGPFNTAGGASANRVAKWDGSSWAPLGAGLGGQVFAIAASGGDLYVGGRFATAGGTSASHIAKWDGSTWSALGTGLTDSAGGDDAVFALAVSGTDVYAGGVFLTAGGVSANYVAKWDGSAWATLGSGLGEAVYALAVSGTDVYAGGAFPAAVGGVSARGLAKWDGSAWVALGTGLSGNASALAVGGADLYVGGNFTTAGTTVSPFIVKARIGNNAPVASAGPDQSVAATSATGTTVTLDGSASADADAPSGDSIVLYEWDLDDNGSYDVTGIGPSVSVPFGATTIRLRVTDSFGASSTDTLTVTVADQFTISIATPPVAAASYAVGQVVPAAYSCSDTANILFSCVGTVPNGANIDTSTQGSHTFTVTATNTRGDASATTVSYTVAVAATTTTVTCPVAPVAYTGAALTPCTASVTGPGLNLAPTPVYVDNVNAGLASASYTFAGDASYLGSSGVAAFTITPAPTTTAVSFEAGPYLYRGTAFTATALVTGAGGLNQALPVTYSGDCLNVTSANGCTASATFAGDPNHAGSSGASSVTITPAIPALSWPPPAAMTYGTALSSAQLNATATVPGSFVYTPTAGVALIAGAHTLSVTFTPTDPTNYSSTTLAVPLVVQPRPLTIVAFDAAKVAGNALSFTGTEFTASGFIGGDAVTGVTLTSAGAGVGATAGTYPIVPSNATGTGLGNYALAYASGTLTVSAPAPVAPGHQVLRHFESSLYGSGIGALLVRESDGLYWGTAAQGGLHGFGTIFRIDQNGRPVIVHHFPGGALGANPGGLVLASSGILYGTTTAGGTSNLGTIFEIGPSVSPSAPFPLSKRVTVLHSFTGGPQGARPVGVVRAPDGTLYGTTAEGGQGFGTVFRLSAGVLVTLHAFSNGSDGGVPGALIRGADGSFYGTTTGGGFGSGTVFRIDSAGSLTTLHAFSGAAGRPLGPLTQGADGSLYGTTSDQHGSVFRLAANGTFTTLHQFDGLANGGTPAAGVLLALDGSVYGTTSRGGAGHGTVFRIDGSGSLATVHTFAGGLDGGKPLAALAQATDGRLFGTTDGSGAPSVGTVYSIDQSGTLTTLRRFISGTEGSAPFAGLTLAPDGAFYGSTSDDLTSTPFDGQGTVFRVDTMGNLTRLHAFSGGDGRSPTTRMVVAADGYLYGTTLLGGTGFGTIFRVDRASGALTTIHNFTGGAGGANPNGALMQAADGHLYGTTPQGVFRVTTAGTVTWISPPIAGSQAELVQAADGSLYGTTATSPGGSGSIFRLTSAGVLSVISTFASGAGSPVGGLVQAPGGDFLGTTVGGGTGFGTVFKVSPSGSRTILHQFNGAGDGRDPRATLLRASNGFYYGTTTSGGPAGFGTVFRIDAAGTLTTVHAFTGGVGGNGATFSGQSLVEGPDGALYGTTSDGGWFGTGTIFRIGLNRAPVADDQTASTPQDAAVALTLTGSDPDNDLLTFAVVSGPTHGTLSGTAPIVTYTPNAGYFGSDSFTFKVSDGTVDSATATVSLTIVEALHVTLSNPNGGESVFVNQPYTVRWAGQAASFDVALSRDGGVTYTPIAGCASLPGATHSCVWTPTTPTSTTALLRVTATNSGGAFVSDTSDAPFMIRSGTPTITLTAPNTAVSWATSTARTITWSHNLGAGSRVRIEVSRDSGGSWQDVEASVVNASATTGSYNWVVSGPATAAALVRVSWTDGPATDVSAVPFTIAAPSITVTAPNTLVNWTIGSLRSIRWSHNLGSAERVNIDVSRDDGVTWAPVATDVPNTAATTGVYDWTVTGPVSQQALIRVRRVSSPGVEDASDIAFRIGSRVTVTSPNTSVTYGAGSTRTITWNHSYGPGQAFDVRVSVDNGQNWTVLATGVPAATATTGTYTGRMPVTPSTVALVHVSASGAFGDGDVSNVPFTLAAPLVTVTIPNTTATWLIGSSRTIRWSHNLGAAEAVNIEVSRDGGTTWSPIASDVANTANTTGSLNWIVSGPATTAARVRVTWSFDGGVTDTSDVSFRIQ